MTKKECGKTLTNAIAKSFTESVYQHEIETTTLGNLFSFLVSNMSSAFNGINGRKFMNPINVTQLADDTTILTAKIQ